MVTWGCALVLLAYLALALGAASRHAAMAILLLAILLWGFASWGVTTAQQARLVDLAPDLASVSLSLNSSAIYLGSATGAAAGAFVVAHGAVRMLGDVAAGIGLAALLTVICAKQGRMMRVGDARRKTRSNAPRLAALTDPTADEIAPTGSSGRREAARRPPRRRSAAERV